MRTEAPPTQAAPQWEMSPRDLELVDFDWTGEVSPRGKPWSWHCGAPRHQGGPGARCTLRAGWGTAHPGVGQCKMHMGNAPNNVKAAEKLLAKREWEKMQLGDDPSVITVDYLQVCAEELQRSYNSVKILDAQVRDLAPEEWAGLMDAEELTAESVGEGTGATGRNTKQSTAQVRRTARVHWWVELWYRERKHLLNAVDQANKIHLSAKQMEFAERQALAVADVFMATFADPELGLTEAEIDKFKRIAYKHLTRLPGPGGTAIEASVVSR